MQFEVMKKSHKKEILIGVIALVAIAIVFIVQLSFAKYKTVKNMKIAEGTINYKMSDFQIMAMYKQKANQTCTEDNCYEEITDRMPTSGYVINETKSYCTINSSKDLNAKIYSNEDGEHVISNLQKGSKCYMYFDKELCTGIACKEILANVTIKSGTPDFSKAATTDEGVYKGSDNDSDTYYWRGASTNNYVKFANKYWRIVRINGDGSIRLIYDGTSAHANGTSTTDSIAISKVKFSHQNANYKDENSNAYTKDNMYVGFKYTSGEVHGIGTKSNALAQLETWYETNLISYEYKLDKNAGFCGDRTPSRSSSTITNSGGIGTTVTYYGALIRLNNTSVPSLQCSNEDLYTVNSTLKGNKSLTYPIGLISADEVFMAGSGKYVSNSKYYLYNNQNYWTMTPSEIYAYAMVFLVKDDGELNHRIVSLDNVGIRPVINLQRKTQFTFEGTGEKGSLANPYIVI